MHPNLRRHELVQQRAEQGGERSVLAHMKPEFSLNGRECVVNLSLFV